MKKKKNIIELVAGAVMPFMSFAILTLAKLVSINFSKPTSAFWVDVVVNTFVLLCFFIPFKSIFKEKYLSSERIENKVGEYAELVAKIYDGKLKSFDEWTCTELDLQRNKYISQGLQMACMTKEEFLSRYKLSAELVKDDKELAKDTKVVLLKIIKHAPKIKQIRTEECLPGTESNTIFNRLTTKEEKEDRVVTFSKVARSLIICMGVAMLSYSFNKDANVLEIITDLGIKLLLGVWHIFGASRIADRLINKVYFKELSEKSLVLTEFLESSQEEGS